MTTWDHVQVSRDVYALRRDGREVAVLSLEPGAIAHPSVFVRYLRAGAALYDEPVESVEFAESTIARAAQAVSKHVDARIGPMCSSLREHGWERIAKPGEEFGEVVQAWIGVAGTNPRKGATHTVDDVVAELLDVAFAALGAVEHLTDNAGRSVDLLAQHALGVKAKHAPGEGVEL